MSLLVEPWRTNQSGSFEYLPLRLLRGELRRFLFKAGDRFRTAEYVYSVWDGEGELMVCRRRAA